MIILLSVLTISGFAGTLLFALSLKKYQKLYYELQIENKKHSKIIEETTREKEQIITEQQHHNSELEKKVLAFDQEREEIYQKALQEVANHNKDNETTNELNLEIAKLNDKIEIVEFQNKELIAEQANKQNILSVIYLKFADEIKAIQEKYTNNVEQNLNIARLQLIDKNLPLVTIPLPNIFNSLNLKPETDFITQYNSENPDKIDYSLIFSASNTVLMIDGIFPDFLVNNQEIIENSKDEAANLKISSTLKERIDFLSNYELQQKMLKTINEIENINYVDKIITFLYIPSEKILSSLLQIDQNLFIYAQEKNINILTPAAIVNIINEARHQLILENSLHDFNYLAKFIEQISSDNSDTNDNDSAEFTKNNQMDNLEADLDQEDSKEENITNIAVEISEKQQINNSDQILYPDDSEDTDASENEDSNIDKLNIGNFLDGKNNLEPDLDQEDSKEENIAENITNIAAEISEKQQINNSDQILYPDDSEDADASENEDSNIDKLNIGNFLDGKNTEDENQNLDDKKSTAPEKPIDTTKTETKNLVEQEEENSDSSEDSNDSKKNNKNANYDDFNIESFLNS